MNESNVAVAEPTTKTTPDPMVSDMEPRVKAVVAIDAACANLDMEETRSVLRAVAVLWDIDLSDRETETVG